MESMNVDIQEIRDALINLYLSVKLREKEELSRCDEEFLKEEMAKLQGVDLIVLIEYIKASVEILVSLKGDSSKGELSLTDENSISGLQKGYNEMLQNLENEVRMHIRVFLLINIDRTTIKAVF